MSDATPFKVGDAGVLVQRNRYGFGESVRDVTVTRVTPTRAYVGPRESERSFPVEGGLGRSKYAELLRPDSTAAIDAKARAEKERARVQASQALFLVTWAPIRPNREYLASLRAAADVYEAYLDEYEPETDNKQ